MLNIQTSRNLGGLRTPRLDETAGFGAAGLDLTTATPSSISSF